MKAYENNLDIFESVFKRSVKHRYEYENFKPDNILIIGHSDQLNMLNAFISDYGNKCISFEYNSSFTWVDLKSIIEKEHPDLILIQRHVGITNEDLTYSVGPVLESIAQEINIPVLLLPKEKENLKIETIGIGFDHKIDNSYLVNKALLLRKSIKNIELIHVEDEAIFKYYIDAIEKIPEINTELAETKLKETILELSEDFFRGVAKDLNDNQISTNIHCQFGETVKCYEDIIKEQNIDLLVFEAEDESKMAMHSLGHSMTIQFPNIATLLV